MSEEQSHFLWQNDYGDGGTIRATDVLDAYQRVKLHRPDEAITVRKLDVPGGTEAGRLLRHVADIVDGARNKTHGDKERSFVGIAKAWERIFGWPVTAADVALAMIALKEQRMRHGDPAAWREHVEDILGYWAIFHELKALEQP